MNIIRNIKHVRTILTILLKEKKINNRLKYIYEDHNNSENLLIVFSGFTGDKPRYNYMKTLSSINADKLFVLDVYGVKGSYYLFENGNTRPIDDMLALKIFIDTKRKYKHIYTLGTSKGGTAAIYYGLLFQVDEVFSGACQYKIGTYLDRDKLRDIFEGMMGKNAGINERNILDNILPSHLEKFANTNTRINLFFSKEEHTYKDHTENLLKDLQKNNIPYTETIESFSNHSDIGKYFQPYIIKELESRLHAR